MSGSEKAATARHAGFGAACDVLEEALRGPARRAIVEHAASAGSPEGALARLRTQLAAHDFRAAAGPDLRRIVRSLDGRGRDEGFHVLLEWEQAAGRFSRDEVP